MVLQMKVQLPSLICSGKLLLKKKGHLKDISDEVLHVGAIPKKEQRPYFTVDEIKAAINVLESGRVEY